MFLQIFDKKKKKKKNDFWSFLFFKIAAISFFI